MTKLRYHIDRAPSLFDPIRDRAEEGAVFCLMDEHVRQHAYPILEAQVGRDRLHPLTIPAGEAHKTIPTCQDIWKGLLDGGAERNSLLLALGGGVVTDIGGFVAATYARGIPSVLVPTTLLGMVDAAIGGKNGVDLEGFKNMVGTVRQPETVLVHPPFLKTLTHRQKRAGFAEMLKHALLDGPELWERTKHTDFEDVEGVASLLQDSIEVKRRIVEADPYEERGRELLNFGHTIGHALETLSMKDEAPLLHGEAVALGMIVEGMISQELLGFSQGEQDDLINTVKAHFPLPPLPAPEHILHTMKKDKKRRQGRTRMVLLERIGKAEIGRTVDEAVIERALRAYSELE